MSEAAGSSFTLRSAREQDQLFLTDSELRQRGLLWLWGVLGAAFFLWLVLDWLWPPPGQSLHTLQIVLSARLAVTALLWAGAIAVVRFRDVDVAVVLVEWVGWLGISLYLGIAGAWLYGGGSALVTTMLVVLVIARGVILPGGLRSYWPPVLLLWGIYVFSLFSFAGSGGWIVSAMLFLQVLVILACLLGGTAAWLLAGLRGHVQQSDRLGRYKIEKQLRTRGMSQLYHAWHLLLQQPCIIKRIPCYASHWDEAVKEFRREARLVMGIQNPHVVRVFDFGETHVDMYLAMEHLDGINLNALLRLQGPLPQRRAIYLMRQICQGLAEVHRQRILHQDLKPSNLFLLTEKGEHDYVKIIDFGIARRLDASEKQLAERGRGKIPGTPAYMAPERFSGKGSEASDIYALGAVLYCLLSGRPPFRASTVAEYQHLHETEEPPESHLHGACRGLLPQVKDVIFRALQKDPDERFPTAGAMEEALKACQDALGAWSQEEAQGAWEELQEQRSALVEAKSRALEVATDSKSPKAPAPESPADEAPVPVLPLPPEDPEPDGPKAPPELILPEPDAEELHGFGVTKEEADATLD